MRRLRWGLVVIVVTVLSSVSWTDTINFTDAFSGSFVQFTTNGTNANGAVISLNGAQLTYKGITLTGYWFDSSSGKWTTTGVNLVGRNDNTGISPDHGIGVCNPDEMKSGVCPTDGNLNEISNEVRPEILQISRGTAFDNWRGVGLSSLDTNSDDPNAISFEHGRLFASNLNASGFGNADLSKVAGVDLLCGFSISGLFQSSSGPCVGANLGPELDINFVTPNTSTYLYLQAFDFENNDNFNNDYLLRSLYGDPPPIPEPGTLMLVTIGLAVASLRLRRWFSR
jgi:hypothetical protein